MKHTWSMDEDLLCCEIYVNNYLLQRNNQSLQDLVESAYPQLNGSIERKSIRMKIKNIKKIMLDLGLNDTAEFSTLNNYSKQNFGAMKSVLDSKNIEYTLLNKSII